MLLADLDVLVLDCQATTANPETGDLLEIGWSRVPAASTNNTTESAGESHLCELPEDAEIPRQVSRITGLKISDMTDGTPLETIWKKLLKATKKIKSANKTKTCLTIIHFARYELPYLHHLHQTYGGVKGFPFQIICTHQVTRRLLPQLPRKGLRAVAGYLGHSAPEMRRSSHHVAANVFVWKQVVQLLAEQGVQTLEGLLSWLEAPPPSLKNSERVYPMPPGLRLGLPQQPGVYRMLRSNGDLLYVGKATSLKQRVNSYFYKSTGHAERTLEMLTQACDLDVTVTGSALEAALLETDEIKQHAPPYNVALRRRDRATAFFSRDLMGVAPEADENFPIGPLPGRESLAAASMLTEMSASPRVDWDDEDLPALALGALPEYAPGPECFKEGFQLFKERHGDMLKKLTYRSTLLRFPAAGLMELGREFHLKRLAELALEAEAAMEEDVEEPDVSEEPEEWVWTPEAVANVMESIIRRGAHLIRRGRWFCLLSEASLAWDTGPRVENQRRLLVFRGGAIAHAEDVSESKETPAPPGCTRPFEVRRKRFDIVTYDRIRVLTTELRRLVTTETDRNVELRFSPTAIIKREALVKALKWV